MVQISSDVRHLFYFLLIAIPFLGAAKTQRKVVAKSFLRLRGPVIKVIRLKLLNFDLNGKFVATISSKRRTDKKWHHFVNAVSNSGLELGLSLNQELLLIQHDPAKEGRACIGQTPRRVSEDLSKIDKWFNIVVLEGRDIKTLIGSVTEIIEPHGSTTEHPKKSPPRPTTTERPWSTFPGLPPPSEGSLRPSQRPTLESDPDESIIRIQPDSFMVQTRISPLVDDTTVPSCALLWRRNETVYLRPILTRHFLKNENGQIQFGALRSHTSFMFSKIVYVSMRSLFMGRLEVFTIFKSYNQPLFLTTHGRQIHFRQPSIDISKCNQEIKFLQHSLDPYSELSYYETASEKGLYLAFNDSVRHLTLATERNDNTRFYTIIVQRMTR